MTEDELQAERRRRGYWLRLARTQAGPGGTTLNQSVVAKAIGLSENSGSAISDMEKGNRDPSATELTRLARLYGVPISWFSEPRPTDAEELERAKELALAAIEAEAEDWDAGDRSGPPGEGGTSGEPRRRTA
jgi:transcriptional regulator with XRE-family HTH domain